MRNIPREIAEQYQDFFNFMSQEHDLILTCEEMDEIVFEAQRLVKKFDIARVSVSFEEGYEKGWVEATTQACQEIEKNYQPNYR